MAKPKSSNGFSQKVKEDALRMYYRGESVTQVCKVYGMSRKTFYQWLDKASGSPVTVDSRVKDGDTSGNDGYTEVTPAIPKAKDYIELYSAQYDFDKAKLQSAAINGYCEGMYITAGLLEDAKTLEDTQDRIYTTLAVLKERRCITDRIIKVFSEVSTSSDEYEQMFGRLFNITPKEEKE